MIGLVCVPTALRVPFTISVRAVPFSFTITPGSIVRVAPVATVTLPSST